MKDVVCPICKGPAKQDPKQDNTIYCEDPQCNFMGILPEN